MRITMTSLKSFEQLCFLASNGLMVLSGVGRYKAKKKFSPYNWTSIIVIFTICASVPRILSRVNVDFSVPELHYGVSYAVIVTYDIVLTYLIPLLLLIHVGIKGHRRWKTVLQGLPCELPKFF